MAQALTRGYEDLYRRNEYVHEMSKDKLAGLVIEATGLDKGSTTAGAIVQSFLALKAYASFLESESTEEIAAGSPPSVAPMPSVVSFGQVGFSYTIYLNLPNTTDPAVFNAIFKSLKENLAS